MKQNNGGWASKMGNNYGVKAPAASNNRSNSGYSYGGTDNFDASYLDAGYFTDSSKTAIRPELTSTKAKELANVLTNNGQVKQNQIRKFYNPIKEIADNLKFAYISYEKALSQLREIIPIATYSAKRGNDKLTVQFADFIETGINKIEDEKDVQAFVVHFRSIVAYTKK